MSDLVIRVNEPVAKNRVVAVRLVIANDNGVSGMTNSDALIKIKKPGNTFATDVACTLTEDTGAVDPGSYDLQLSLDSVSVSGEMQYEITDATAGGRFQPVHGFVTIEPIGSLYYGKVVATPDALHIDLDSASPGGGASGTDGFYALASTQRSVLATVVDGAGKGQARVGTDYAGANHRLLINEGWVTALDTTGGPNNSIIEITPITATGSGGGGGAPTAAQNAAAVAGYVADPSAPPGAQTIVEILNMLAAYIAGNATGYPSDLIQTLTFMSLDGSKARISGSISSGVRTITARDGD